MPLCFIYPEVESQTQTHVVCSRCYMHTSVRGVLENRLGCRMVRSQQQVQISESCPLNTTSPLVVTALIKHVPSKSEHGLWPGFAPRVDHLARLTPGAPRPAARLTAVFPLRLLSRPNSSHSLLGRHSAWRTRNSSGPTGSTLKISARRSIVTCSTPRTCTTMT